MIQCKKCSKFKDGYCRHWCMDTKPDGYCHEFMMLRSEGFEKKICAIQILFPKAKYLAMDADGKAYIFTELPRLSLTTWLAEYAGYQRIESLQNYSSSYKKSLINIEEYLHTLN